MRQSFAWWSFKSRFADPLDLLKAAADIGYDGVELLPQELWPAAKSFGLSIVVQTGHGPIHQGFTQREEHPRIVAAVRAKIDEAVANKIPMLILFSGNRQPGMSDDQAVEITAEGIRAVAQYAESAGVDLVLELLNSKRNHEGYQADHTEWGVQVCKLVNSPRVKLLYDIFHMQIMEGDLVQTITDQHEHIAHYHTAGCPGRAELSDEQEINYHAVFKAIARTGYAGYIGHELTPKGDPIAALRRAYELVKAVKV